MSPDEFIPRYGTPCRTGSWALDPEPPSNDKFYLMENGTVYIDNSDYGTSDELLDLDDYCLASIMTENGSNSYVTVCFEEFEKLQKEIPLFYPITMILSLPCLVATFVVYAIIPELQTMHGLTLRAYIACLFVAYVLLIVVQIGDDNISSSYLTCSSLGNPLQIVKHETKIL